MRPRRLTEVAQSSGNSNTTSAKTNCVCYTCSPPSMFILRTSTSLPALEYPCPSARSPIKLAAVVPLDKEPAMRYRLPIQLQKTAYLKFGLYKPLATTANTPELSIETFMIYLGFVYFDRTPFLFCFCSHRILLSR